MDKIITNKKSLKGPLQEIPSSAQFFRLFVLLTKFGKKQVALHNIPNGHFIEETLELLKRANIHYKRNTSSIILEKTDIPKNTIMEEIDISDLESIGIEEIAWCTGIAKKIKFSSNKIKTDLIIILKELRKSSFTYSIEDLDNDKFILSIEHPTSQELRVTSIFPSEKSKNAYIFALMYACKNLTITELISNGNSIERILEIILNKGLFRLSEDTEEEDDDNNENTEEDSELARRLKKLNTKKNPSSKELKRIKINCIAESKEVDITLPSSLENASPFVLLSVLLPGSSFKILNLDNRHTAQNLITYFKRLGADIKLEKNKKQKGFLETTNISIHQTQLSAYKLSRHRSASIGDLFPYACAAAAFAKGETVIRDCMFLREGKIDLIKSVVSNLKIMGADLGEIDDGIVIRGKKEYDGCEFNSYGSPHIGMAFAIVGTVLKGESKLKGSEAIDILYPGFLQTLESITQGYKK